MTNSEILLAAVTIISAILGVMLVLVQTRLQRLKNEFEQIRGDNEQQAQTLALFQKMLDLQEQRDAKRGEELELFRTVSTSNQQKADETNQNIVRLIDRFEQYVSMQRQELVSTRQSIEGSARQSEIGIDQLLTVVREMSKTLLEKAELDEIREIENAQHIKETHDFIQQAFKDFATLKEDAAQADDKEVA